MKKTLISLAILAGMAASSAAVAEVSPYVRIHMSMDSWDDADKGFSTNNPIYAGAKEGDFGLPVATDSLDLKSRKSVFGVNGSEDVDGGNKVFYKLEWEVKPDEGSSLTGRDQYLGIKFGHGSVKIGTMSNNYKDSGMGIDKLKHTGLEARGFLNMQSQAHAGKSVNGGRSTNTVQYSSPKMGGMQMVINRTFQNEQATTATGTSTDETTGVGFRAEGKTWEGFFDYIDMVCNGDGIAICLTDGTESGFKVGGKIKLGSFSVAVQVEDTGDIQTKGWGPALENSDIGKYTFLQGVFNLDRNNSIILSLGAEGDFSTGAALAYMHKTGSSSNVYVGVGARSDDIEGNAGAGVDANEQTLFTAGWSASFN